MNACKIHHPIAQRGCVECAAEEFAKAMSEKAEKDRKPTSCHPNCGHTEEEHSDFDLGFADAHNGQDVAKRALHKRTEAYLAGHSAGVCDLRDSDVLRAWMAHSGISEAPPYYGTWQESFEQFVAGWDAREKLHGWPEDDK